MLFFRRFCVVVATALLSAWLLTGCVASPQPQPPVNGELDAGVEADAAPPGDASTDGGDGGPLDADVSDASPIDGAAHDGSTH